MKDNRTLKLLVIINIFSLVISNVSWAFDEFAASIINNSDKILVTANVPENYYIDTVDYPSIFSWYYMSQYRGGILDGVALGLSDKDLRKRLNKSLITWNILDILKDNFIDVMEHKLRAKLFINNSPTDKEADILRDKEIEDYSVFNEFGPDLAVILRIREYLFTRPGVKLGVEVKLYSFPKNEVIFHKIIELYSDLSLEEATKDNAKRIRKAGIELSRKTAKVFLSALGYSNYKYSYKELRDIKKNEIKSEMDRFSNNDDLMRWQSVNLTKQEVSMLQKEKEKAIKDQKDMMRGRRSKRTK